MRFVFLLFFLLGLTACQFIEAQTGNDSARLAEARAITSSLPDITEIWKLTQSVHEKSYSVAERKSNSEKLESYRATFRRLHSLIKRGDQMSDFPGLLALGGIRWRKSTQMYELHCGVYDEPIYTPSTPPWYSRAWVRFDSNGRIREIKPHGENW